MKPISITKNGIEIFNDDFFRAWLCVLGIIDYHDIPYKKTNNQENIVALNKNFCFGVTRKIKPPLGQRLIDGATHLPDRKSVV
jgi:hypothetical protein